MKANRTYRKANIPDNAQCVFEGILFDVYQWEQELFDGSKTTFERLVGNDIVKVIPVMEDGTIIVVTDDQPAREPQIKIPGGYVDPGETPEQTAARELKEECAVEFASLVPLKDFAPWNKVDYRRYFFVAHGCKKVGEVEEQAGERITVKTCTLDEFLDLASKELLYDPTVTTMVLRAKSDPAKMAELKKLLS